MKDFLFQPPEILEGVGPKAQAALKKAKISTIGQMLAAGFRTVASAVPRVSE